MMNNPLVWSPVHRVLEDRIRDGDSIILILVPFIKLAALQQLHWVHAEKPKLKIICRWRPEDLLAGASDLEVFPYLKESGCQLYINPTIHLKLYAFDSNLAFNTSGNLTLKGLGYTDKSNIEVGNLVTLTADDWSQIYSIIGGSRQVDDDLYRRFKALIEQTPKLTVPDFPLEFAFTSKQYTIASLPAVDSPAQLRGFYFSQTRDDFPAELVRRASHDLVTFGVASHLTESEFDTSLQKGFLRTPFVIEFISFLRNEKTLRFGAVNSWIHEKCEDVPLPYRWELKDNTRMFYDWLAHFVPEISWDRPRHSQVIRWTEAPQRGEHAQ